MTAHPSVAALVRACTIAALLVGGACALSPQTVTVRPELSVPQGTGQAGKSVALQVNDTRPSPLVGKRGGVYQTADITTDPAMPNAVRDELARVLTARGFQVVNPGQEADIRLNVEVANLGYDVTQQKVTKVIATTATVRASSQSGDTQRTGEYSDRRTKEVVKAPSIQDNEELVNGVLSGALQRLVSDPDLLSY